MKKIITYLLFFLTVSNLTAQPVAQDKNYKIGHLANGLTYYIRHNAKETGIADFYIAQRVGSILEEPRQRGLAHFLEHMAFNGTEHFRSDSTSMSIVSWCESIGVKFGTNLNAYTSVDQTVYNISAVPVTREGIIDSTLLILHDWSHSLLLTDNEIDKERGVIHEEWRTRRAGMAAQRMVERLIPVIYKGTKYENCLPIGSMEIVDKFPYQDLRDYYHKWYRPDLQAIIIVGDINVEQVETKIKNVFGSIPLPERPTKRVYYPVYDNDTIIVAVDKDAEQPIMLATLYMKHDATPDSEKQDIRYQRDSYIEQLIIYMLNSRLQEMQRQAEPPTLSLSARSGSFFVSRMKEAFSISFGCRQENIQRSFNAALGATERARQHGFTPTELLRAKKFYLNNAQRRFAERNDRRNNHFVRKALQNFLMAEPIISEEEELRFLQLFNSSITLDEINRATNKLISDRNQVLVVMAPDKPEFVLPTNAELKSYVAEAQTKRYEPYKEQPLTKNLISKLPKKGTIISEKSGPHGTTLLTLSNGIEVYVKPTEFQKDQISMRFFGPGGTQIYPDADVPNFNFLSSAITEAGVGIFDENTLRKMLTGKTVQVQPSVSDKIQALNGNCAVKDLTTMMQLTHLYFTSPRRDDTVFAGSLNRMRSFLTNREASPKVSYNDSISKIVYGNSPRVQPMKREMLDRVSYNRILQIYRERFSDARDFRMLLIGNVDLDALRPLLCQYIASLPARPVQKEAPKPHIHDYPDIVGGQSTHLFKKKTATPQAQVSVFYTFEEPFTAQCDLALDVFKRVLQIAYTDSIREEKGGVYGVSISANLDKESKPTSLVKISFTTDPQKYADIIPLIDCQIMHIARQGPLATSLDKVKKYLLKAYGQNIITNGYWDYIIYNQLRHGIDYHTDYEKFVNGLTAADIQQVATDLLNAKRRIEVTMLSE